MNVQNSELTEPLAIICGGGALPFAVADAVLARGRKVVLFPIEGVAEAKRVADYSHRWIAVSRQERLYAGLRDEGCRDVVLIGSLTRPPLSKIRFGLRTLLMLPTILSSFRGGDNHLLSKIERVLARYGFRVVGAHEVAPEILIGEGDVRGASRKLETLTISGVALRCCAQ